MWDGILRFKFGLSGVKRNERVRSEKGEKALNLYAGIGFHKEESSSFTWHLPCCKKASYSNKHKSHLF